jgi:hypothetical protein
MPIPDALTQQVQTPYGPQVAFGTQGQLPPGSIYLSPQDSLFFQANSQVSAGVFISYRILRADGTVIENDVELTVTPTGAVGNSTIEPPSEGFLLSIGAVSTNPARGQVFLQAYLVTVNATDTLFAPGHMLMQGYVSSTEWLGFPQSPLQSNLGGRGSLQTALFTAGAAGSNLTGTIPASVHWRLISITAQLVTDATAGNRTVFLEILDPGGFVPMDLVQAAQQAPSTTRQYTWAIGCPAQATGSFLSTGIPDGLYLPASWQVKLVGVSGAGDQWGNARALVEQWVTE